MGEMAKYKLPSYLQGLPKSRNYCKKSVVKSFRFYTDLTWQRPAKAKTMMLKAKIVVLNLPWASSFD